MPGLWHLGLLRLQAKRGVRAPELAAPTAAPTVRIKACRHLAMYLRDADWKQEKIADYLNYRGQTTLRGRPWTQASVSQLLRANPGASS